MSDTATNEVAAATPGSDLTPTPPAPPAPAPPAPDVAAPPPSAATAPPDHGFFLDGDAPRLGSAPTRAPSPEQRQQPLGGPAGNVPPPAGGPALPVVSPVLTSPAATGAPDQATLPTLPSPAEPTPTESEEDETGSADPQHPMAHLMPAKSQPSEAQKRAAELRAAKKAKARKIKLGVAGGFLVFAVALGPPLFSWLSNAVNEAGDTSTEEPAE